MKLNFEKIEFQKFISQNNLLSDLISEERKKLITFWLMIIPIQRKIMYFVINFIILFHARHRTIT